MISATDFGDLGQGGDDAPALQSAIDTAAKYGHGLILPPSAMRVKKTLFLPANVWLHADCYGTSFICADGADITVLEINGSDGGVEGLSIFGLMTADCAAETVRVKTGVVGSTIRDSRLWGGGWGLAISAVDCHIDNCNIQGTGAQGGNIVSNGANWYNGHLKCDDGGQAHRVGFWQQWNGSDSAPAENHFTHADFTGNFTEGSIRIDDMGHHSNITAFAGCVFNKECLLYNTRWTGFSLCEFGADVIVGNGACSIGSSYGFAGIKALGAAGAGNIAITT